MGGKKEENERECNPIGRDKGLKIPKVWVRIPPLVPNTTPT